MVDDLWTCVLTVVLTVVLTDDVVLTVILKVVLTVVLTVIVTYICWTAFTLTLNCNMLTVFIRYVLTVRT